MYLGDTLEEKRESYILLTERAKKLGIFFGAMGVVAVIIVMGIVFSPGVMGEGQTVAKIFLVGISCLMPFFYYYMGYLWYFGFVTVKSWFLKLGIGVGAAAGAVSHSMAVSYILGGRKTAKLTGVIWLVAFGIALTIGFYVGLYDYIKIRSEAKQLGFLKAAA